MFTEKDLNLFSKKGLGLAQIESQINAFETGFPFLNIAAAASPNKGVTMLQNSQLDDLLNDWDKYLASNATILKFVPASGAASRMFKDLFEFIDSKSETPDNKAVQQFFDEINKFAFVDELNEKCINNTGLSINELVAQNKYKTVVSTLLDKNGLNYGALPKGLLLFHSYNNGKRTPMQEHLVEGAMYAANGNNEVNIHFTVSTEHRVLFEKHLRDSLPAIENSYAKKFMVSFSEQKPSTDTIAVDENNQPFREDDTIVFRPGGHGALIENLNDLDADVIFVKNIDNVVPDSLKNPTIMYKKMIAGLLVNLQKQSFEYLEMLDKNEVSEQELNTIAAFVENDLNNIAPKTIDKNALKAYLYDKLNRPMRVCGMVKNTGEPGGGPFITENADGSFSTQILESSQIDLSNPVEKQKMMEATHFNPVDLVCAVKNYKGEKFDLTKYVDARTGFISEKSKSGRALKALELPGLWNGAMSNWNTVFVEVPITTFNPVKTVNDLLRIEHQ